MSGWIGSLTVPEEDLEQALKLAADLVDLLPFSGVKLCEEQKRAWPRSGVYGPAGDEITGIPPEVELLCEAIATCLLADASIDMSELSAKVAPFLRDTIPPSRIH
ncbi:hypothetical protein [Rhizobium sp. S96]|uniref:hypothetical protein n=1 Tax=Rhizobium sp. S96 TaxID=3055140 RepID=UPI0025AAA1FD|nr:hypothetical protein [Rhizobium sp. S96]MDM9624175.1 hypothetical protein [Rhizobium sp. S96]